MNDKDKHPLENDPLFDPLVPEKVYIELEDGRFAVDSLATAHEYGKALTPKIESYMLRPDDELLFEFDDETKQTFKIKGVTTESLAFGSDDVVNPTLVAEWLTEEGHRPAQVKLLGSSISPSGSMFSPGRFETGWHLNFYDGKRNIFQPGITSFRLRRNQQGRLTDVPLNSLGGLEKSSVNFEKVTHKFQTLSDILAGDGFSFDQTDPTTKLSRSYVRVSGDTLVYASRQGFGSKVMPQDEVHVYNLKDKMLRSIRNIPGRGVMQMAVVRAEPDHFTEEAFAQGGRWQAVRGINSSTLHRLSKYEPFITYTWLSSAAETPTITIRQSSEAEIDALKVNDGASRQLQYASLELDIELNDKPTIEVKVGDWWVHDKAAVRSQVEQGLNLKVKRGRFACTVGTFKISGPVDPAKEIDRMIALAEGTVYAHRPKKIGASILKKLTK